MDGVVELCARELGRLESNRAGSLEHFTVREHGTGAPVACVSGYEDAVVTHVGMVNQGEASVRDDQTFDCVEGNVVVRCPNEGGVGVFGGEGVQDAGEVGESGEERRDVADKAEERVNIMC